MKLSKHVLILLTSYLGMLALVAVTARLLVPLGGENASGKETAAGVTLPAEVTDAAAEESDAATVGQVDPPVTDAVLDTAPETDAAAGEEPPVYCLRTVKEDGETPVIGVYDADGNLLRTVDTPVYALPAGDRALLEVGIEIEGEDALSSMLEDFSG